MCYRRGLYRNPVKACHRSGFDKTVIHTDCCKCPSCRKKRSADWLVRSYYEFKYALPNRQAFFISLDFDNQHRPLYKLGHGLASPEDRMFIHDIYHLPDGYRYCFDSEEIKSFLHRLRYYIGQFRYFISTDYGGALKMPHYHMAAFPKNFISQEQFLLAIERCWPNGSHQDLELLPSVDHNKIKALKYISEYTTKDVSFDLDTIEAGLPLRFRSRVHVSANFGLCAIEDCDIPEFISKDMIKDGSLLALPLGKNGTLLKFQIPRYYEMKYTYDYSYNRNTKISELIKNDFGVEVAKLKHNQRYVYQIKAFFASRNDSISDTYRLLEDTVYHGWSWRNIVFDVMSDFEDFCQFVYYRDFLTKESHNHLISSEFVSSSLLTDEYGTRLLLDYPRWHLYDRVFEVYNLSLDTVNRVKDQLETEKLVRGAKLREYWKIRRNRQKFNYLQKIGFDINSLLT